VGSRTNLSNDIIIYLVIFLSRSLARMDIVLYHKVVNKVMNKMPAEGETQPRLGITGSMASRVNAVTVSYGSCKFEILSTVYQGSLS